jgi:hypothetical protein
MNGPRGARYGDVDYVDTSAASPLPVIANAPSW